MPIDAYVESRGSGSNFGTNSVRRPQYHCAVTCLACRSAAELPLPLWFQELNMWQNANAQHLTVSYHNHKVVNGSELSVHHVKKAPKIAYKGSETYTLMLLDPDVPSHEQPENRNL